jgi:hypothetical protein
MECPAVVQLGQRVELRDRVGLLQLERATERRADAVDDVLECRDVGLAVLPLSVYAIFTPFTDLYNVFIIMSSDSYQFFILNFLLT